ncbi:MAG: HD domain-containing protein [Chloroflexota bacterium]
MSPLARLAYRFRQFRLAFLGPWPRVPDKALSPYLSPALITIFRRMTLAEQAHSLSVLERLQDSGQTDPDLLAAALLHDVGKSLSPLSIWERVLIVLGKHFFPQAVEGWGDGEPRGLRRPFMVAIRHPAWGADLVAAAGASPRTVDLVRRHQDLSIADDLLLAALQQADDIE